MVRSTHEHDEMVDTLTKDELVRRSPHDVVERRPGLLAVEGVEEQRVVLGRRPARRHVVLVGLSAEKRELGVTKVEGRSRELTAERQHALGRREARRGVVDLDRLADARLGVPRVGVVRLGGSRGVAADVVVVELLEVAHDLVPSPALRADGGDAARARVEARVVVRRLPERARDVLRERRAPLELPRRVGRHLLVEQRRERTLPQRPPVHAPRRRGREARLVARGRRRRAHVGRGRVGGLDPERRVAAAALALAGLGARGVGVGGRGGGRGELLRGGGDAGGGSGRGGAREGLAR
mmetsp:Transcript_24957/g.61326  ORF Transcript_24957/g.61326 Transcript_24957/m.61326 type:complete len:296 (+) Transcript_24957:317-1204(+)